MAIIKKKTERVTSQPSGYQSRFATGNVPKGVKAKVEQKGTSRTITYTAVGARKKATPAPKPNPLTFDQRAKAAEAELRKLIKQGKVKDIAKTRSQIAKKYGVSPNGYTN